MSIQPRGRSICWKIGLGAALGKKRKIPNRLYKYRSCSSQTVGQLVADQLFFADPSTFNDPLDTKPSLATDLDVDALADVFRCLVERRIHAKMSAAAEMIKYCGQGTLNHIATHSRQHADEAIADIYNNLNNIDDEEISNKNTINDIAQSLLGWRIEGELRRRYDKGIVSLAERSECPLMWSHYGDQHKGVCIGYSVPPDSAGQDLYKVTYGDKRLIKASTVTAMLNGDDTARCQVDQAVLARKAKDWGYEREWRLVGPQGVHASLLELEEVVFGMRCSPMLRYVIVKALADRLRPPKFYEICESHETFLLSRHEFDTGELIATFPRSSLAYRDIFKDVVIPRRDDA